MIELQDIHVTFNPGTPLENHVLKGIDLTIDEGEFVTVIGGNGAGKSTLLNVLAGEIIAQPGRVLIGGRDVTRLAAFKRADLVARVYQDPLAGTCSTLTLEENMALAFARGRRRRLGRALDASLRGRLRDNLARLGLGLEDRLHDSIGLLSGGQRQAVSLLMAALQPMEILLLDEHTAALDPRIASFVLELSADIIREQRLTALMVTHSMRQALDVGHRTIMMDQGEVAFDVKGEEREGLGVPDLLRLFERARGEQVDDDSLLLG
ncbi:ATP-binding cassette domain-containing protein [Halomonas sp. SSL-5]|uniref:ABC transporter ATP-binding protein n=1 Tax=Halomonas sp. SSL-5 TaxID=3065855 RepID=UPI00273A0A60|nr:ATP-binding cassette domain-containing protein [Halomonas sp. SSL-5]MDY7115391.1 ATP-binding cassette domain-containing protein [Halomonas sp. SSL-5]